MSLENTSLRNALQEGWVNVEFTKKDKSLRLMKCTTNIDLVPEAERPVEKPVEVVDQFTVNKVEKPVNLNFFRVYEQNNGWRSFNFDQLVEWTTNHELPDNNS